jgi:hypothetical protein
MEVCMDARKREEQRVEISAQIEEDTVQLILNMILVLEFLGNRLSGKI